MPLHFPALSLHFLNASQRRGGGSAALSGSSRGHNTKEERGLTLLPPSPPSPPHGSCRPASCAAARPLRCVPQAFSRPKAVNSECCDSGRHTVDVFPLRPLGPVLPNPHPSVAAPPPLSTPGGVGPFAALRAMVPFRRPPGRITSRGVVLAARALCRAAGDAGGAPGGSAQGSGRDAGGVAGGCALGSAGGGGDGGAEPGPPRQQHIVGEYRSALDSGVSGPRRVALDAELARLGIDAAALLTDPAQEGAPALKAYNTFINPRRAALARATAQALGPAAARAAHHVAFLARQRRAELADYVRNADRAARDRAARGAALQPLVLVLDNVRSAYNVGSILRTAETAAVREVVACGLTPTPPHAGVRKTAFSAAETVPVRHVPAPLAAVRALQAEGCAVFGLETTARSRAYVHVDYPRPTALVLGNEVTGIDPEVLDACDGLIEIPTFGLKNSLNVAAACPVVVFEVLRRWGLFEDLPVSGNDTQVT